jgi:hypothetical protein
MASDEGLAQRIREALTDQPNLVERKMFAGIGFMLRCDERRDDRARGSGGTRCSDRQAANP